LLHCPALTEISSAEKLLDWGFAADGKVTPVGTLVGPRQPPSTSPAATPPAAAPPARDEIVSRSHPAAASPSVLAAAGFSCAAVLAAVLGFTYSRRQRLRAARSAGGDRTGDRV
jgi:serine-type D-Ala-D-Ala carboxypeptidase (penicillin-binding protein 5/6)